MDPAEGWSRLHHGIDPSGVPLLRGWLALVWTLARPLRAVPPIVFTALGALLAVDAVLLAARLPWVAFALVLVSVLCDALDGAVALFADRASRFGAVADRVADRIADLAFAAVLWRCGAPWWTAVLAAVLTLGQELWREVRGGRLRSFITVSERPTRTICTLLGCASAGVSSATWPPTLAAAVWIGLSVVGIGQLAAVA